MGRKLSILGVLFIAILLIPFTIGFWQENNPPAGIKSRLALKDQGIYLKEVKDIDVYVDDGYPNGRAEVVVVQDGHLQTWEEQIFFGI